MKFKEILNESWDSDMKSLEKLTKFNDHIGAYILGAKVLKSKHYEQIFTGVKLIQDALGHSDANLVTFIYKYYKEMMKYAEKKLGDKYEEFYSKF